MTTNSSIPARRLPSPSLVFTKGINKREYIQVTVFDSSNVDDEEVHNDTGIENKNGEVAEDSGYGQ